MIKEWELIFDKRVGVDLKSDSERKSKKEISENLKKSAPIFKKLSDLRNPHNLQKVAPRPKNAWSFTKKSLLAKSPKPFFSIPTPAYTDSRSEVRLFPSL